MARIRQMATNQPPAASATQHVIPLDDGTMATPAALAMIRALISLGLKAIEERVTRGSEYLGGCAPCAL